MPYKFVSKMLFIGQIRKMSTHLAEPIQYYLNLSNNLIYVNELFDKKIKIKHIGYQCIICANDRPVYRMGFCKKCFFESPYASETILKPELSTAHLGIEERNLEIEKQIQIQPHIVYLAYTGDVKVGVTRESQVPTRWIDQGASFALPIARTTNRYEAGMIEVELKKHFADKTNWRKMLQNKIDGEIDLHMIKNQIYDYLSEGNQKFLLQDSDICALKYPYVAPERISSFTLDKKSEFEGILLGIKGQYLYFEGGDFINIRAHEGYFIELGIVF